MTDSFLPEHFYHVYNRSNNQELLFRNESNYHFFIQKMELYLSRIININSYCLLPNHFHISIATKSIEQTIDFLSSLPSEKKTKKEKDFIESPDKDNAFHDLISHQFSRLFNSYAQAYNKIHGRKGNLFYRPFKRAVLDFENKFSFNQYYIHHNPRKHGIIQNFEQYKWSSYKMLINETPTFLNRDFVFDWFGGKDSFIDYHHKQYDFK